MLKKVGINAGIGAIICFLGVVGYNVSSSWDRSGWEFLIYGGLWYAGISVAIGFCSAIFRLYKKSTPYVEQALSERDKKSAYDELLRLKKLCDENIITREEFDDKARDLKAKML